MARFGRELDDDGNLVYKDYTKEMGYEGTYIPSDLYYYTNTAENSPFVIENFNKKTISHSTSSTTDDVIEFGFYMPEHMVTPNTITYPNNIDPDAKQYYKPAGVGQSRNGDGTTSAAKIATFVRIHGSYTDHNGQILGVSYDIYLGQNNYDDFTIKRNQLLNNKLIITGLTNHKDAYPDAEGNISIDHRVEVSDRGFNLSMERTAILDAHFEVRPLDIELSPNSQMTITIPQEYRGWIAMEDDAAARSGVNSSLYVNTTKERKGVRKYFTNNLVSELNTALQSNNTKDVSITISNNESGATTTKTFRIWFYIDENPNVYDKTGATTPNSDADGTYTVSKEQYRVCPVKFKYMGTDKDGNTMTKDEKINFQQWNLWRVWNGTRYYDIEHEEEYLNNYASDQQYGSTQNGMPWGLDGIQLSSKYDAFYADASASNIFEWIGELIGWSKEKTVNASFSALDDKPLYDFYLSRDTSRPELTVRNYSGRTFNEEIIEYLFKAYGNYAITHLNGVRLVDDPESAIAYCYNKNKRNSDGEVVSANWYLPAIDEIEDIALGAYDEFDAVFQGNLYWSCQPAYIYNELDADLYRRRYYIVGSFVDSGDNITGPYYLDDANRARATRVLMENGVPVGLLDSGSDQKGTQGGIVYLDDNQPANLPADQYAISNSTPYKGHPGNLNRTTDMCRIRAVYRSGTK